MPMFHDDDCFTDFAEYHLYDDLDGWDDALDDMELDGCSIDPFLGGM